VDETWQEGREGFGRCSGVLRRAQKRCEMGEALYVSNPSMRRMLNQPALTSYSLPEPSRRETYTSRSVYSGLRGGCATEADRRSCSLIDLTGDEMGEVVSMMSEVSDWVRSVGGRIGMTSVGSGCTAIFAHGRGGTGGGRGPRGLCDKDVRARG
jgi:hypothetical protein